MKKETTNTFLKGMIKDLHPLTTPNDVLTDALNGTLITYNGNEGVLLNDMGNVKIKNALLKAGYVPVGMKEHGGIIYVAAYNPTTEKGQVGSFPSPKQLWEGENWDINKPIAILTAITIPPTIYNGNFIVKENVKLALFTSANGEARIFHPGDKYIIGFPAKNNLASYVQNGYVDVQLGVVKSDGGIEIMKTWTKGTNGDFLYGGDGAPLSDYLSDVSKVQVFDASSSGEMILIINLNTLDSFNLLRAYSITSENKIKVTFTGEATKDNVTYSSSGDYLRLATESSYDKKQIELEEGKANNPSMIYPNVPFGIIKRMGRSIDVDFDKIRKTLDSFGEWRFYVTETYVKIGWAYDFYNLDGSKKIEYIKMYFHKLEDGYNRTSAKQVTFLRESYNGNFEDYINYEDAQLKYRRIYIVEIVRKLSGAAEELIIDFKMLYLSKLYNQYYNGFYDNNFIGLSGESATHTNREALLYNRVGNLNFEVKLTPSLESELIDSNAEITGPGQIAYKVPTKDIRPSMYTTPITSIDNMANIELFLYLTNITNEYKNKFKLSGELENIDELYIGKPKDGLVHDLLGTYSLKSIDIIRGEKEWIKSNTFKLFAEVTKPDHRNDYTLNSLESEYTSDSTVAVTDNVLTLDNIKLKDNRFIQGTVSDVRSATLESKGLKPLYAPDYTPDRKNRVAPYWNVDETLCMSGAGDGSHKTIHYNSKIMTAGNVVEGPDAGAGCNDVGLYTANAYMGRPMTNIFSGSHGEDAELTFTNLKRNSSVANSMGFISPHEENGGNYLDYLGDNFLIACWKFTDGDSRFVNLLTKRDIPAKSTVRWPRLDVMLRSILSLIFIVNKILKEIKYITTDEKFYRYQLGTTKIKITLNLDSDSLNDITNDIMVSEDVTASENNSNNLNNIFASKWNNGQFSISTNGLLTKGSTYNVTNLIPVVNITKPTSSPFELEIPNFYDIDVLLGYYLGVKYNIVDDATEGLDIKAIYKLDMNKLAENAALCVKSDNGLPKPNLDGTFEWKDTPYCVPITDSNTPDENGKVPSSLYIHRWNDPSTIIEFPLFYRNFTTKADTLDWSDIPENEDNEVYATASIGAGTAGEWTDAADEAAPNMSYTTLYSPDISALKNTTG